MSATIKTTHAGALPRDFGLTTMIRDRWSGKSVDAARLDASLADAVKDAVRRQIACGLDSINDGELSKTNFMHYITERVGGFEVRDYEPGQGPPQLSIMARDRTKHADYFSGGRGGFASGGVEAARQKVRHYICAAPLTFVGADHVRRDTENFRKALSGTSAAAPFMPSVTLGTIEHWMTNEHYKTQEEFLYAIGETMRQEYLAIIDAGFMLQLDDPDLTDGWQMYPGMSVEEYRRYALVRVEALNHALRGIPKERIRIHVCWGSYHGPHEFDLPLKHLVDILFRVNASQFSIEAANPRHEHEWQVFENFKVPDGSVLIPGVVGHCTDFIEHPELVAQRLLRYAKLIGPEKVMAGTDCGLGNRTATPSICWAKMDSLVEGARLASKAL